MELTAVAEMESEADAARAIELLRGAGIVATYVDSELLVPDRDAHRAIQLLNASEPAEIPATATVQCPECGSFETRTVPPYAHIYVAVFAGMLFFWRVLDSRLLAVIAILMLVGFPFFQYLVRVSGKERCRRCGWLFSVR